MSSPLQGPVSHTTPPVSSNSNERKQRIQQGFDTVTTGYDHPSLSFFPETARRMAQYLNLEPQQHLLDICTGAGVVAIASGGKQ